MLITWIFIAHRGSIRMTREEAWQGLQGYSVLIADGTELKEALRMAIEALQTDVVRCNDCKHRPHLENENGSDYGFNVSGDERCPCVNNDDGWYSWMPKDNFYCGFGERKGGGDE
jgi:hypothetical protein